MLKGYVLFYAARPHFLCVYGVLFLLYLDETSLSPVCKHVHIYGKEKKKKKTKKQKKNNEPLAGNFNCKSSVLIRVVLYALYIDMWQVINHFLKCRSHCAYDRLRSQYDSLNNNLGIVSLTPICRLSKHKHAGKHFT